MECRTRLAAVLLGGVVACACGSPPERTPANAAPVASPASGGPEGASAGSPTLAALARAEEILGHYRKAAGGEKLDAVRRLRLVGVSFASSTPGNKRLTFIAEFPQRFRQDELTQVRGVGRLASVGYDGRDGWYAGAARLGGQGRSPSPATAELTQTRAARQAFINVIAGVLPAWLTAGQVVAMTADGAIDTGVDRGARVVKLDGRDGHAGRLLFDPSTDLPRRLIVPHQQAVRPGAGTYTVTYSDFRPTAGVMLPHTIERKSDAGGKLTWSISAYEVNPELKAEIFARPGTKAPPK